MKLKLTKHECKPPVVLECDDRAYAKASQAFLRSILNYALNMNAFLVEFYSGLTGDDSLFFPPWLSDEDLDILKKERGCSMTVLLQVASSEPWLLEFRSTSEFVKSIKLLLASYQGSNPQVGIPEYSQISLEIDGIEQRLAVRVRNCTERRPYLIPEIAIFLSEADSSVIDEPAWNAVHSISDLDRGKRIDLLKPDHFFRRKNNIGNLDYFCEDRDGRFRAIEVKDTNIR